MADRTDDEKTESSRTLNMDRYAVLIPWITTQYGESILLEVRSQYVRQPGEVCFPGGKIEPGESAAEAAVRETCEELGLEPVDIDITGIMDPLVMGDGREVYPVAGRIRRIDTNSLDFSSDEVEEVFLLPFDRPEDYAWSHFDLAATPDEALPEKLRGYLSHYGEYRKTGATDYLEYDGHGIWGLTARIIQKAGCVMSVTDRTVRLAGLDDMAGIKALLRKYHRDTISDEDRPDGFVTTAITDEQLAELIEKEKGVTVIAEPQETGSDRILGFCFAAPWEFWSAWPLFRHMIDIIPDHMFEGKKLAVSETYQYGLMCVDRSIRGTGAFEALFFTSLQQFRDRFPVMLTFVNQINKRSENAHTNKAHMETIAPFDFGENHYYLMGIRTDAADRYYK